MQQVGDLSAYVVLVATSKGPKSSRKEATTIGFFGELPKRLKISWGCWSSSGALLEIPHAKGSSAKRKELSPNTLQKTTRNQTKHIPPQQNITKHSPSKFQHLGMFQHLTLLDLLPWHGRPVVRIIRTLEAQLITVVDQRAAGPGELQALRELSGLSF